MCKQQSLYKYYSWNTEYDEFRLNGGLYFPSPVQFNDPLDCNLKIWNNIKDVEEYEAKRRIREVYPDEDVDRIFNELKSDCKKKTAVDDFYRKQQEALGILSLSKTPINPILWANYAQNDGFCIEYNRCKLESSINEKFSSRIKVEGWDPHERVVCEDVHYRNMIDQHENNLFFNRKDAYRDKYWTKHKEWQEENEFRIGVSLGGKKTIDTESCIESITLGINPTVDRYVRCLSLLKDNNVDIYLLSVKNGKFERVLVNDRLLIQSVYEVIELYNLSFASK